MSTGKKVARSKASSSTDVETKQADRKPMDTVEKTTTTNKTVTANKGPPMAPGKLKIYSPCELIG